MEDGDSNGSASSEVAERDARAALESMLADEQFRGTERHRKLLRYVVEEFFSGRRQVKAYTIAVDVFGRPTSFDPMIDPIVRVEAARLRAALSQYYQSAGDEVAIRVELAKGNYVPRFVRHSCPIPSEAPIVPVEVRSEAQECNENAPVMLQPARRISGGFLASVVPALAIVAGALHLTAGSYSSWDSLLSTKPTIVIDVSLPSGAVGQDPSNVGRNLVHALSHFSAVQTLMRVSAAGDMASKPAVKRPASKEYKLTVTYSIGVEEHRLSWQVVETEGNTALRAGTAKEKTDSGNAREVQEKLLARLARAIAGEDGVITSLEAARQRVTPTIGSGCVSLAYVAMAQFDKKGLASAHDCLDQSVTFRATDPDVLASLALVLVATGDARVSRTVAARALKLADKAVALAPRSSLSYVAQMQARFAAGEREAAFTSGRQAVVLNPLDDTIPASLGLLHFVSGQYSEGVRLARLAQVGCEPLHRDAALTLALEAYRSGRYREALTNARQLANPADTAGSVLRVAAAGQLGLTREAAAALNRVRWNMGESPRSIESELTARGFAPGLIALLNDGLRKAGVHVSRMQQ
ncbi:tetratricopeptide (TPR) repeat protein [Ensifer sp. KUDG1]|uniref:tetratricopeptide repeat protein n=1 Tax=Ensifer sp. KUDG1 TaxID=3373919 RepID=UPI003D21AFC2